MVKKKRLGRGLSALIETDIDDLDLKQETGGKNLISINEISISKFQTRKKFDEEKLKELSESIAKNGLLQPIIVRKGKKNFELVSDKKTRVILPNTLTLIGVCIGLSSIKFALDLKYELAIIAIVFAALIDSLDGRIARLIKGTSKVGKELDSLTDVISFGVAPAFIMYFWSLNNLGKFGWLLCLVYVVCVVLRLARFNVSSNEEPSWKDNFFIGVPAPAGGILVLMPLIYSLSEFELFNINFELIVPIFFAITSFLLISKIPTYSLKKIIVPRAMTIFLLFSIVLFFGLLLIYTFKMIILFSLIYLCFIPISFMHYQKLNKKFNVVVSQDDDHEDIL